MVASNDPVYDSIKLKFVCVSSGAPRLFEAVRNGVTDPSHSADRIGLNKKQIVAILYQLCYGLSQKYNWFECGHAVFLKNCHLNRQGLSAEHVIGSPCNRHNLSSCNTRSINEFVSGAILHNGNLCS